MQMARERVAAKARARPALHRRPPIGLFVPRVLPKETLQAGIELKKYPRRKCCSARPALRVLWLNADGQLCLARQKTAKTVKKAIRLENIARVEVGAKSRNFQGLGQTRYQLDVEGNEALCVSIYGSGSDGDAGGSFHVKLASKQAAEELAALLDEPRREFEKLDDAQVRRAVAKRYSLAPTGRRRASSADFQGETHMMVNAGSTTAAIVTVVTAAEAASGTA